MICTSNLNFGNKQFADESLTKDEKSEAISNLSGSYDKSKIIYNEGTRRVCENCNKNVYLHCFCEYCVQNHL